MSVNAGGAKGGTEKVRSFVTFSYGWTSLTPKVIFLAQASPYIIINEITQFLGPRGSGNV